MPIFAFAGSLTRPAPNYAAANGRGITTLRYDAERGQLAPIAEYRGVDDASWLEVDVPRRRLYAACEVAGTATSWMIGFAIEADGSLRELDRQPCGGQTVCHASFSPDRRLLAVANYNAVVPTGAPDGAIDVFPLDADGRLGQAVARVTHTGSGPNPDRQERSHAHCVMPSPDGRWLYAADLGMDRIVAYAWEADGTLTHRPDADFAVAPGVGPRHLVFQADGRRLLLISELQAQVLSLEVDPATGALRQCDAFAIEPTHDAIVQPSGIVLAKDGHTLFAALRQTDEIIGLGIDSQTGRLTRTGRWPSGGATPRDLTLSPDGRFLVVANQDADRLTVFPIADGRLGTAVQSLEIGTPMAIKLAAFPT